MGKNYQVNSDGLIEFIKVINKTGISIAAGKIVYVNGFDAVINRPTVALAKADVEATRGALGFTNSVLAIDGEGFVTAIGMVKNLDTSAFTSGDEVFLSDTTAGEFTATEPTLSTPMGVVTQVNVSTGEILTAPTRKIPVPTDTDAIHDNVAGEISVVTEKVTPVSGDFLLIEDSAAANAKKRVQIGNLPDIGENNTASNVSVGGVGVFKQKTGVDLEFRGVNAASSKAIVVLDAANNEIDIDVADASATQAGAIELATQAEVDTGTDAVRAVVPSTLAGTTVAGIDSTAIHDNVASEISVVTEKVAPVSGDFLLIEDSAVANVKKRVQVGNLPAPGGTPADTFSFRVNGKPTPSNSVDGAWIAPRAGNITRITLWRGTAGSSGSTTIDVNKNAVTLYTTQANRPSVTTASGNNALSTTTPDITSVAQDDIIKVDVDVVESGNPNDLSVTIEVQYT